MVSAVRSSDYTSNSKPQIRLKIDTRRTDESPFLGLPAFLGNTIKRAL